MIPFTCGIWKKNDTVKLIYKPETDSQIQKANSQIQKVTWLLFTKGKEKLGSDK